MLSLQHRLLKKEIQVKGDEQMSKWEETVFEDQLEVAGNYLKKVPAVQRGITT